MSSNSRGIGFFGLLGIVFIVLKLVGTIAWSWFWVLAPFWGPFAAFLIFVLFIVIAKVVVFKG